MIIYSLAIVTLSLSLIFLSNKYLEKFANITKLLDKPDKIRKFHKKRTPLLGGIMIFSSFVVINLYLFFWGELNKTQLIIFISSSSLLILGLIDDIKNLHYKHKFIILIIFFFFTISLDPNLKLNKIYFSTFNKEFYLTYLSIPFTILCLLLLTNALNFIDGINGLCILISTIIILWLINFNKYTNFLYILLVPSLVYIFYLNLQNRIFLGNSGSLFLGCLLGLNIIYNYNLEISKNNHPVEDTVIVLMLLGLDMLRVFIIRVINNKDPFLPDRTHIHHLLIDKKIPLNIILLIFFILIMSPIIINQFLNILQIKIIFFYIFFYVIFYIYLSKKFLLKK
jgi:UDP-GlcNAc:undecaprenyl-phosphate GlcNAc-1-phosphate transferase